MNHITQKLSEIESRPAPENLVFLRPNGALTALLRISEHRDVSIKELNELVEDIHDSQDNINKLLWTVPQARSFFRKMIVGYLNESQTGDWEEFLRYFQGKPMTAALKNTLSIHLHENSTGLVSAFNIWSKLHSL
jgi:hypothetical protein